MKRPDTTPVAHMDDAAIEAETVALEDRDIDIRRQLEDDKAEGCPYGVEWRHRARTARRHVLGRLDALRREQAKRHSAAKAERVAANAERERARGELFVLAAYEVLDIETRAAIWDHAQAKFPDSAAWEQRGAVAKPPRPAEGRPTVKAQTLKSLAELKALL